MKQKPIYKVDSDGTRYWMLNNKLHREDGPAVRYTNNSKFWYLNGKPHREDGPAIEAADGSKFWFLNGKQYYSEREYWTKLCELGKITEDELFLKLL